MPVEQLEPARGRDVDRIVEVEADHVALRFHDADDTVAVAADAVPPALTEIVTAGEQPRMTPQLLGLLARLPACRLHNHYGPTETHVATAWTGPSAVPVGQGAWPPLPPIGRPMTNIHAYVLDRRGRPVPVGVPAELHLGGEGMARGYLGRPAKTAEQFIRWLYAELKGG